MHLDNTLTDSLKENNTKPFWKYIKNLRQDNVGVAPIRSKGKLHTNSKSKAELLNQQFQSVFTNEDHKEKLPDPAGRSYPTIDGLVITYEGVHKSLQKLNTSKAVGPDAIPNLFLKNTAPESAKILQLIFRQSLQTGALPKDWREANISPIYKKGDRNLAQNYRPVSLTSVSCKILEHIIVKHMLNHFDKHNILTKFQHGFRRGLSCETQLLETTSDLLKSLDAGERVDVAILDFSKAFDTVPHRRLMTKLNHFGVKGNVHSWIRQFLQNIPQKVVVDGESSGEVRVASGVPQGTVLGPLLFLCHINDLPVHVNSHIRLFADDCLLYRTINCHEDHLILQRDLHALTVWTKTWGMSFNANKCYILPVNKSPIVQPFFYQLDNTILRYVQSYPYLGVTLQHDLKYGEHVNKIACKAGKVLGLCQRNLKHCPQKLKELAYFSLVRSMLDNCASIWDPYLAADIRKLETIQRRAARFVTRDYHRTSSVAGLLSRLEWPTLEERRRRARLVLLFKIKNQLVGINADQHLIPADQRTRGGKSNYKHILTKSAQQQNSFFPRTIRDWNCLPKHLRDNTKLDSFKSNLNSMPPKPGLRSRRD